MAKKKTERKRKPKARARRVKRDGIRKIRSDALALIAKLQDWSFDVNVLAGELRDASPKIGALFMRSSEINGQIDDLAKRFRK